MAATAPDELDLLDEKSRTLPGIDTGLENRTAQLESGLNDLEATSQGITPVSQLPTFTPPNAELSLTPPATPPSTSLAPGADTTFEQPFGPAGTKQETEAAIMSSTVLPQKPTASWNDIEGTEAFKALSPDDKARAAVGYASKIRDYNSSLPGSDAGRVDLSTHEFLNRNLTSIYPEPIVPALSATDTFRAQFGKHIYEGLAGVAASSAEDVNKPSFIGGVIDAGLNKLGISGPNIRAENANVLKLMAEEYKKEGEGYKSKLGLNPNAPESKLGQTIESVAEPILLGRLGLPAFAAQHRLQAYGATYNETGNTEKAQHAANVATASDIFFIGQAHGVVAGLGGVLEKAGVGGIKAWAVKASAATAGNVTTSQLIKAAEAAEAAPAGERREAFAKAFNDLDPSDAGVQTLFGVMSASHSANKTRAEAHQASVDQFRADSKNAANLEAAGMPEAAKAQREAAHSDLHEGIGAAHQTYQEAVAKFRESAKTKSAEPQILAQGKIGETHQTLADSIIKNPDTTPETLDLAIEAGTNDKLHQFVDSEGNVLDRKQAGAIALKAGQIKPEYENAYRNGEGVLQSQHLQEATNPGVPKIEGPVLTKGGETTNAQNQHEIKPSQNGQSNNPAEVRSVDQTQNAVESVLKKSGESPFLVPIPEGLKAPLEDEQALAASEAAQGAAAEQLPSEAAKKAGSTVYKESGGSPVAGPEEGAKPVESTGAHGASATHQRATASALAEKLGESAPPDLADNVSRNYGTANKILNEFSASTEAREHIHDLLRDDLQANVEQTGDPFKTKNAAGKVVTYDAATRTKNRLLNFQELHRNARTGSLDETNAEGRAIIPEPVAKEPTPAEKVAREETLKGLKERATTSLAKLYGKFSATTENRFSVPEATAAEVNRAARLVVEDIGKERTGQRLGLTETRGANPAVSRLLKDPDFRKAVHDQVFEPLRKELQPAVAEAGDVLPSKEVDVGIAAALKEHSDRTAIQLASKQVEAGVPLEHAINALPDHLQTQVREVISRYSLDKGANGALKRIAEAPANTPDGELQGALAKALSLRGENSPITVDPTLEVRRGARAEFIPRTGEIKISAFLDEAQTREAIIHEKTHAVLFDKTDAYLRGDFESLDAGDRATLDEVMKLRELALAHESVPESVRTAAAGQDLLQKQILFEQAKASDKTASEFYGLLDPHEFMTGLLSNTRFQHFLNEIGLDGKPRAEGSTAPSIWSKLKTLLRNLVLGGKPVNENSVLARGFDLTVDLLRSGTAEDIQSGKFFSRDEGLKLPTDFDAAKYEEQKKDRFLTDYAAEHGYASADAMAASDPYLYNEAVNLHGEPTGDLVGLRMAAQDGEVQDKTDKRANKLYKEVDKLGVTAVPAEDIVRQAMENGAKNAEDFAAAFARQGMAPETARALGAAIESHFRVAGFEKAEAAGKTEATAATERTVAQQANIEAAEEGFKRDFRAAKAQMSDLKLQLSEHLAELRQVRANTEALTGVSKAAPESVEVNPVAAQKASLKAQERAGAAGVERGTSETRAMLHVRDKWLAADQQKIRDTVVEFINKTLPPDERGRFISSVTKLLRRTPLLQGQPEAMYKNAFRLMKAVENRSEEVYKGNLIDGIKKAFNKSLDAPGIDVGYRRQLKEMYNAISLAKPAEQTLFRLRAMQDFVNRQKAAGKDITIPQEQLEEVKRLSQMPLRDMTTNAVEQLHNDIQDTIALGRLKAKLLEARWNRRKERALEELGKEKASPLEQRALYEAQPTESLTSAQKFVNAVNQSLNHRLEFEQAIAPMDEIYDHLDGNTGTYNGWTSRNIKGRLDLDFNAEQAEINPIRDSTRAVIKQHGLTKADLETVGIHGIAKMIGEDRLLEMGVRPDIVDRIQKTPLTAGQKAYYDATRAVYDMLGKRISDTAHQLYQQDVTALPNYVSLQQDWAKETKGRAPEDTKDAIAGKVPFDEKATLRALMQDLNPAAISRTEQGFLKERIEGAKGAVKLNAQDVFERHLNDALHFIHMQPGLKMLGEITRSKDFAAKYGDLGQEIVLDHLDSIATQGIVSNRIRWIDWIRNSTSKGAVGFRLASNIVHSSQLPLAAFHAGDVTGRWWTKGLQLALTPEGQTFLQKHAAEIYSRGGGEPAQLEAEAFAGKFGRAGFFLARNIDKWTAAATFMGRYAKEMEKKGVSTDSILQAPIDPEVQALALRRMHRAVASPFVKDIPQVTSRGKKIGGNVSVAKAITQFRNIFFDNWSNLRHDVLRVGQADAERTVALFKQGETAAGVKELGDSVGHAAAISFVLLASLAMETGIKMYTQQALQAGVAAATGVPVKKDPNDTEQHSFAKQLEHHMINRVPFIGQAAGVFMYGRTGVPVIDALVNPIVEAGNVYKSKKPETKGKHVVKAASGIATLLGVPGSSQALELAAPVVAKGAAKILPDTSKKKQPHL